MIKVLKNKANEYTLMWNEKVIHCATDTKLIVVMNQLGIQFDEIEFGLTELIKNDHDVAHYGIGLSGNGPSFIFSKKVA